MFVALLGGLFAAACVLNILEAYTTGMALFPIPVAFYLSCRAPGRAAALVAAAGCAGLVWNGTALALAGKADIAPLHLGNALSGLLVAGAGVPMGFGFARRWRYGQILTATTAYAVVLMGAAVALHWDLWVSSWDEALAALKAYSEDAYAGADQEAAGQVAQAFDWLRSHWLNLGFGLTFCQVLLGAAFAQWLTAWWLGVRKCRPRLRNRFRTMRTPDWLVWLVIAGAALWFADRYWSVGWARLLSWNGLIALAAVYWLNGLSVLVYAAAALRPHPAVVALVLVMMVLARTSLVLLVTLGLFDTWGEFRRKIDRIAALRRSGLPKDGDSF